MAGKGEKKVLLELAEELLEKANQREAGKDARLSIEKKLQGIHERMKEAGQLPELSKKETKQFEDDFRRRIESYGLSN